MNRRMEWKRVERSRTPFYLSMQRLVVARFRAERDAVQAAVKDSLTPDAALIAATVVIEEQEEAWTALLRRIYRVVSAPFAQMSYGRLTGKAIMLFDRKHVSEPSADDIWQEEVEHYVTTRAPATFARISGTSTRFIRAYLADAIAEGESVDQMTRRIRDGYQTISRRRARVIARTETISASNAGGRAGALATGLDLRREWIATIDDRTRDTHLLVDGQQVPMETPYAVGDSRMMFPGDTSLGADASEIIQCRCTEGFIPV